MASPGQSALFTTFTELVSTTYRNHKKEIANNIETHNALLRYLNDGGRKRMVDGGLSIVEPLDYQANGTVSRYSGYDTLSVAASDVISAAEYPWRQLAGNVVASGLELRTNSARNQIINLAKSRMKNLQRSMSNQLANDIYSDGTAANQIGGLQALVSDAGTGTVGGINSTTFTFWKSIVQSAAAPLQGGGAITPSSTTIESLMLPLWLALTRGNDMPNIIIMDQNYFTFFEVSQTSLKRYAPEDSGKGGMVRMKYKTADVLFDGSGIIPSNHAYFLNTDFLEWCVHPDADYEMVPEIHPTNQDAVIMPVLWQGNLACSARKLQGVVKA
jgi:hypothetical protein